MTKHTKLYAFAGLAALTAALTTPASPAKADTVRNSQWHLRYLRVSQAHDIIQGAGITVAVVDTGVFPHPDLKRNLLKGSDIQPGGDEIGHVDAVGHGTEMASLIAAHGNGSSSGVLGISPLSKILPVKDANTEVDAGSTEVGAGIDWAIDNGAKVVNVSSATGPSISLKKAVSAAQDADVVIVAGSGNKSRTASLAYPAAMAGVLAVGAVDRNGRVADFSVRGDKVEICAPGVEIIAAEPKSRYAKVDGTSPATAIVSGAAALVRARFPDLSAADVVHRLTATADDNGPPGRDDQCGFGVLNIVKALTADVPPLDSGGATASATPSSAVPATTTPAATTPAAAPETEPASSSTPLVVGVIGGLVVVGGLVAFLFSRRRRVR